MAGEQAPSYRDALALVHHMGFAAHADACAPGLLALLEPLQRGGGEVLELGCGSGLLTRHLLDAGHRVIATDASPAMLRLAAEYVPEAEVRQLTLPDDRLPSAAAIVSVGHVLSYLPDEAAIDRALVAVTRALRPGGIVALDLCDLAWGEARRGAAHHARVGDDWALIISYCLPTPDRFVRDITTFLRSPDGTWRRDDERHETVLVETSRVPGLLSRHGVEASVGSSFGAEELPAGLRTIIGHRRD